tara:strand:+ start:226 stop:483 length:258 start_codon:yes stop_codon:yes gene_type:complete
MAKNKKQFDDLDADTHDAIRRQMHRMSVGIDALEGLGLMASHAVDEEIGVTGEQIGAVLKCIEFSLLTTQRKIVAALEGQGEDFH